MERITTKIKLHTYIVKTQSTHLILNEFGDSAPNAKASAPRNDEFVPKDNANSQSSLVIRKLIQVKTLDNHLDPGKERN